jgi:Tol biopolymer transport system component
MPLARARRAVIAVSFASSAVFGCNGGSRSLGLGPEREGDSASDAGASGGATGSGGSSGGGGGAGTAGSNASGGSSPSGGSGTGTTFGVLTRVSGPGEDTIGNGASYEPALSADGRFVVYTSAANNLVPADSNGAPDVFLHDRVTRATARVSVDRSGAEANGESRRPAISGDGSRIVFATQASSLGAASTSRFGLVITDAQSDLASFAPGGTAVTPLDADADSSTSLLTNDGSLVVFRSFASNLTGGDVNGREDFFLFETGSGALERIPTIGDLQQVALDDEPPRVSADLSLIAFAGVLDQMPRNVYVYSRESGVTEPAGVAPDNTVTSGECWAPSLSAEGRFVAFVCNGSDIVDGDTNGVTDVFVRDLVANVTERVSVTSDGTQADGPSSNPVLSADGHRVVFQTLASNLGPGPELGGYGALAVHDLTTHETTRITSLTDSGADGPLEELALSYDGRVLVFTSSATNFLLGDRNASRDVFAYEFLGLL